MPLLDAALALGSGSALRLGATGGVLAFAESALGVGFVLPGEAGIVGLGGVAADGWLLAVLFVFVVLGATAGDHVGYAVGRRVGPRMATWRVVARLGPERWAAATGLVERRGARAVFVSRLVPVARTLVPAVAGVAGLGYRRFVLASVAGAALWSAVWVGLGAAGGTVVGLLPW